MSMTDTLPARARVHPVLWLIVAVMVGFELMFAAADAGYLPGYLGRGPVYLKLAFLDLLFDYAVEGRGTLPQVWWSPLTHAFLHGGWLHLAFNAAAFLGLGHALVQSVGIARFLAIFVATAVAGALSFGLIAQTDAPMVGASGAIFGFLGVITAWQERVLRLAGMPRGMIWRRILGLVALNVLLAFGLGGLLAWEAHLGGWVAGWLLAGVIRPRRAVESIF